jgi:hypothetical protein
LVTSPTNEEEPESAQDSAWMIITVSIAVAATNRWLRSRMTPR